MSAHPSTDAVRFLDPLAGVVHREPPPAGRRGDARDGLGDFGYVLQLQPAAISQFSSWLTLVSQCLAGAEQWLYLWEAGILHTLVADAVCPSCACERRAPVARYRSFDP